MIISFFDIVSFTVHTFSQQFWKLVKSLLMKIFRLGHQSIADVVLNILTLSNCTPTYKCIFQGPKQKSSQADKSEIYGGCSTVGFTMHIL